MATLEDILFEYKSINEKLDSIELLKRQDIELQQEEIYRKTHLKDNKDNKDNKDKSNTSSATENTATPKNPSITDFIKEELIESVSDESSFFDIFKTIAMGAFTIFSNRKMLPLIEKYLPKSLLNKLGSVKKYLSDGFDFLVKFVKENYETFVPESWREKINYVYTYISDSIDFLMKELEKFTNHPIDYISNLFSSDSPFGEKFDSKIFSLLDNMIIKPLVNYAKKIYSTGISDLNNYISEKSNGLFGESYAEKQQRELKEQRAESLKMQGSKYDISDVDALDATLRKEGIVNGHSWFDSDYDLSDEQKNKIKALPTEVLRTMYESKKYKGETQRYLYSLLKNSLGLYVQEKLIKKDNSGTARSTNTTSALSDSIGLSDLNLSNLKDKIASRESGGLDNPYRAENKLGYLGKYQLGATALVDAGLVKRDEYQKFTEEKVNSKGQKYRGWVEGYNQKKFLSRESSWINKDGKEQFLNNKELQEYTMDKHLLSNRKALESKGVGFKDTKDLMGKLMASHLGGVGNVSQYVKKGKDFSDANGTKVSDYYEEGSSSYDSKEVPKYKNNTKVNRSTENISFSTNEVRDGFGKLKPNFREKILNLSYDYKAKTGKNLIMFSSFRSIAKQKQLFDKKYNEIKAKNPKMSHAEIYKATRYTVAPPGKSRHNFGNAVDIKSAQMNKADKLGLLSKYSLHRPLSWEAWHIEPKGIRRKKASKPNTTNTKTKEVAVNKQKTTDTSMLDEGIQDNNEPQSLTDGIIDMSQKGLNDAIAFSNKTFGTNFEGINLKDQLSSLNSENLFGNSSSSIKEVLKNSTSISPFGNDKIVNKNTHKETVIHKEPIIINSESSISNESLSFQDVNFNNKNLYSIFM